MKVRDIFVNGSKDAEGVARRANDALLESLADAVTGQLGGKIGIARAFTSRSWSLTYWTASNFIQISIPQKTIG